MLPRLAVLAAAVAASEGHRRYESPEDRLLRQMDPSYVDEDERPSPTPPSRAALLEQAEQRHTTLERRLKTVQASYLATVEMGLLGGLAHSSPTDPAWGGTTDYVLRNECLGRNWETGEPVDNCVIKWDGYERLRRVEDLYGRVHRDGVPGDLVECGVWRGGITVMMRALLEAHDDPARRVWAVDSFAGVPDAAQQRAEVVAGEDPESLKRDLRKWGGSVMEPAPEGEAPGGRLVPKHLLTVEEQLVRDNFQRFGLLDDRVKFVKGYFNDTLPSAEEKYGLQQIALLRVDGDLYSSTMDVLKNLYPLVSPGGWVILDDWPLPPSRNATIDFLRTQGLGPEVVRTDRLTPEQRPVKSVLGDVMPPGFQEINKCGYFQKPL